MTETEEAPERDPGLVQTIRDTVGEVIGELFDSGKADVQDAGGSSGSTPAPEKTLTAADVQRLARDEMARAQAELRAKRKKTQAPPAPAQGGDGATSAAASPPAVPANPRSWRNRLWGTKE